MEVLAARSARPHRSALRGENPTVLLRMPSAVAVMGDVRWLPGYCVLLTDDPHAERLSDPSTALSTRHDGLRAAIARHLRDG